MTKTGMDCVKKEIDELVGLHGSHRDALIPILREIKKRHGLIDDLTMQTVADRLGISPVEVYGVATFYAFLGGKRHGRFTIRLCRSISCGMAGKEAVARRLTDALGIGFGETTPDGRFTLEWTNCIGMCDRGPAMLVNELVFTRLTPKKAAGILSACGKASGPDACLPLKKGRGTAVRNRATFASVEAEAGLTAALGMRRPDVIAAIRDSGMKGRGGAGFPTGIKWNLAAAARADRKFVVCNADEGEPGTFKDRVILQEWPDLVFEGMTVAGYAIGASEGILYLRGEYEHLREGLEKCLAKRRETGLLGKTVRGGNGLSFDVHIRMGCGAYVCGEETALIESLEGRRGEARNRPPFPVNTGLNGMPTIVNNVETFAWAAVILSKGANWFKGVGTEGSTGPKLLSVSGDVERPGVYEFPLGVSVRDVLKAAGGLNARAVVVGGASGRCVSAREFSRAVSYEDAATGGAIVVFGPDRDMRDAAESFLEFFVDESCGQCTPCRLGNVKLLEGARMLGRGECSEQYLEELCSLGETMQAASKCGLGQSSPNAFLSIVGHFRREMLKRGDGPSGKRRGS